MRELSDVGPSSPLLRLSRSLRHAKHWGAALAKLLLEPLSTPVIHPSGETRDSQALIQRERQGLTAVQLKWKVLRYLYLQEILAPKLELQHWLEYVFLPPAEQQELQVYSTELMEKLRHSYTGFYVWAQGEQKRLYQNIQQRRNTLQGYLAYIQSAYKMENLQFNAEVQDLIQRGYLYASPQSILQVYGKNQRRIVAPVVFCGVHQFPFLKYWSDEVAQSLQVFIKNYNNDNSRPVLLQKGIWNSKLVSPENAANQAFSLFQHLPVFIADIEYRKGVLRFHGFSWCANDEYFEQNILADHLLFDEQANDEQKAKSQKKLIADETWHRHVQICYFVHLGLYLDEYYFRFYGLKPRMPEMMLDLCQGLPADLLNNIVELIVQSYQGLYLISQKEEQFKPEKIYIPELMLDMVLALTALSDHSYAQMVMRMVPRLWLQAHSITEEFGTPFEMMASSVRPADHEFIDKWNYCASILLNSDLISKSEVNFNQGMRFLQTGVYQESIQLFKDVLKVEPSNMHAMMGCGHALMRLQHWDQAIECYRRAQQYGFVGAQTHLEQAQELKSRATGAAVASQMNARVSYQPVTGNTSSSSSVSQTVQLVALSHSHTVQVPANTTNRVPAASLWQQSVKCTYKHVAHKRVIWALDMHATGHMLVSGADQSVRLWDAHTGQASRVVLGQVEAVRAVLFSPDGHTVVAGSGQTIRMWDSTNGSVLQELKGHQSLIWSLAYHPSGRQLASASANGNIRIWDLETAQTVNALTGHRSDINALRYSPNGAFLASASADNTIRVWNPQTGDTLHVFSQHRGTVNDIAFSPDGQYLASASDDKTVRIWDLATGRMLPDILTLDSWVLSVAFSPDGRTLATGTGHSLHIWDAESGECLHTLDDQCDAVRALCFHPKGRRLMSASGNVLRFWDIP